MKIPILLGYSTAIVGITSSIVLQPMLYNSLGADSYIIWTNILIYIGYYSNALVGFQNYGIYSIAKGKNKNRIKKELKGLLIFVYFITLTIIAILAHLKNIEFNVIILIILLTTIIIKAINDIELCEYYGKDKPNIPKTYELISKTVSCLAIGYISWSNIKINSALMIYFGSVALISFMLLYNRKSSFIPIIPNNILTSIKNISPYVLNSIPNTLIFTLGIIIVTKLDTDKAVSTIFYFKLFSIVTISTGILVSIYYGRWSIYINNKELILAKKSFISICILISLLTIILSIALCFFDLIIFKFWVKDISLVLSNLYIMSFMLFFIFASIRTCAFTYHSASGLKNSSVVFYWLEMVTHIILGAILCYIYGVIGYLLGVSILFIVSTIYILKK